ncbi:tetratricopeptide repeat protein [Actinoplanes sp. NPDC049548]|uniref:tetratricopeptide repeat protein n=1 Tax=Actinoplanes sp. NPDC049548 TaxID=3155152 RepID=UPI003445E8FA
MGEDADALYELGWAKRITGFAVETLASYNRALELYRAAGDRGNEAATLSNIGLVHDRLGDRQRALDYCHRALPIRREVG